MHEKTIFNLDEEIITPISEINEPYFSFTETEERTNAIKTKELQNNQNKFIIEEIMFLFHNILSLEDVLNIISIINDKINNDELRNEFFFSFLEKEEKKHLFFPYNSIINQIADFKNKKLFDQDFFLDIEDIDKKELILLLVSISKYKQGIEEEDCFLIEQLSFDIDNAIYFASLIKELSDNKIDPRFADIDDNNEDNEDKNNEKIENICTIKENIPKKLIKHLLNANITLNYMYSGTYDLYIAKNEHYQNIMTIHEKLSILFQDIFNNVKKIFSNVPIENILEAFRNNYIFQDDTLVSYKYYHLEEYIINQCMQNEFHDILKNLINELESLVIKYFLDHLFWLKNN